jgi:hypothetical protein
MGPDQCDSGLIQHGPNRVNVPFHKR